MSKKQIGIVGGTFNPPHLGHLIIANEVLHALDLEEIRFMPNHVPPHKEKLKNITDEERIKMLTLSIKDHPQFKLETIEMERSGPSYTYDTIMLLKNREPDVDFYFIIGADMIEYLPKWHKIDELVKQVTFVGVNRPSHSSDTEFPILHIEIPEINLSSTLIRERLSENRSVKYLLKDSVLEYIKETRLYGTK
ncbi:nicotinate-nucleotide adenylyltransferase [Heyndrickxia acidicola]|uniref:Probable nicotinate-nucleotide adenylyltransferase n=1 Tax=Heyndrickxia acidicola TaxID=209389 RepID=A0ABU6MK49_9BACI|nr:nicotinate-nucleotide adenylyltransferase [Heyndrickxia acidicola]MED1205061.1 nicotinate-nucleotide adenylyltransferase [Heyndrickxia acidicola]